MGEIKITEKSTKAQILEAYNQALKELEALYSMKTNNRRCYGVAMNWKHRDAQKVLSMDSQEEEFNNEKEVKDEKC